MNIKDLAARVTAVQIDIFQTRLPETTAYKAWRRRFLRRRLQQTIQLALIAYLTFIIFNLIRLLLNLSLPGEGWLGMAVIIEMSLLGCWCLLKTPVGQRHPGWIFLGCSWSITLIEQIWATSRGIAFPGIFAWTLVFLSQATFIPVHWRLHVLSQIGVLGYYLIVNTVLNLPVDSQVYWDETLWLYLFWFCCICDLGVFLYERLQKAEFQSRRELEAEKKQSERLLLNILPQTVAQQLKRERRTIAENFAEVTVLFADIVGFTQMSAGIPPDEMVTLLNKIFSAFDRLAAQHGLEKIKTIGDAYMVVGGLPLERKDHIEAIADMALDMQRAIARFNLENAQSFSIRIGINTGPVVAGVIGVKKFIYDLWGDTVNIASRMESHGIPDRIQVTSFVYERLKDHYHLEERGEIDVKGRGKMMTYLLLAKKEHKS